MPESTPSEAASLAATGIAGLDDILGGRLPRGRLYLVEGNPGAGKTTLAMQFLLAGVAQGERGLCVSLSETAEELRERARTHGWSLGGIELLELTPSEALAPDAGYTMFHPSEVELTETTRHVLAVAERIHSSGQGGLGIGLPLARHLVELHGGRIEARSGGAERGCEFIVRMPLGAGEAGPRREGGGWAGDDGGARSAASIRVLVVDDNQDAADSLAMLLGRSGAATEVAYDGEAALAAIRRSRPGLVLLDVGMPGMDGYEVARRVREDPALCDVVLAAVTGWGQSHDRARSKAAGFDHHLVKPVELGALEALLSSVRAV